MPTGAYSNAAALTHGGKQYVAQMLGSNNPRSINLRTIRTRTYFWVWLSVIAGVSLEYPLVFSITTRTAARSALCRKYANARAISTAIRHYRPPLYGCVAGTTIQAERYAWDISGVCCRLGTCGCLAKNANGLKFWAGICKQDKHISNFQKNDTK